MYPTYEVNYFDTNPKIYVLYLIPTALQYDEIAEFAQTSY